MKQKHLKASSVFATIPHLIAFEFSVPLIFAPRIYIHVARVHGHLKCRRTLNAILLLMRQDNGIRQENTSLATLCYWTEKKEP